MSTPASLTGRDLGGVDDCPICGRPGTLVSPVCTEGHGGECPDRLCVDCGAALFVDPPFRHRSARSRARIA
jgi:hypothetical protein